MRFARRTRRMRVARRQGQRDWTFGAVKRPQGAGSSSSAGVRATGTSVLRPMRLEQRWPEPPPAGLACASTRESGYTSISGRYSASSSSNVHAIA